MDDDPDYLAAITDFTESNDCATVEFVALNPRCVHIARLFRKKPQQVAGDIHRIYAANYSDL